MNTIGFIGTGNIASAIIPALLQHQFTDKLHLYIYDIHTDKMKALKDTYGINTTTSSKELVQQVDIIVLSVKPFAIYDVINEIKSDVSSQLIISPVAGIPTKTIQDLFEHDIKLVRIMPNIGAMVRLSMTAYVTHNISSTDVDIVQQFLLSFGKYIPLKKELFNSFTTLCGSSPAFFVAMIQSMVEYAVQVGYEEEQARSIITQTMLASAHVMLQHHMTEQDLIQRVATKGGTTEAGLHMFDSLHFDTIVKTALDATTKRSESLQQRSKI